MDETGDQPEATVPRGRRALPGGAAWRPGLGQCPVASGLTCHSLVPPARPPMPFTFNALFALLRKISSFQAASSSEQWVSKLETNLRVMQLMSRSATACHRWTLRPAARQCGRDAPARSPCCRRGRRVGRRVYSARGSETSDAVGEWVVGRPSAGGVQRTRPHRPREEAGQRPWVVGDRLRSVRRRWTH